MYASSPFVIQLARICWPVPPREPSMFRIRKAPGPTFWRSRVVFCPKQGQPLPDSIGCFTSTPMGAAYWASFIVPTRAEACAPTVTLLRPNTLLKKPGACFVMLTLIVSLAMNDPENAIPPPPRPPPFLSAYSIARPVASPVDSGSACAPASAAASAVCCRARSERYHEPTSRTSAAIPSSTVMKTRVRTVVCPRLSLRMVIPHAPSLRI